MSLQKIQETLKAPKSQYNSFGKYNYRNLEDIQEAVKPLLSKYGYSMVICDSIEQFGDRFYVKATATIYDKDMKPVITNSAFAREALSKKGMDESQITGACSSYARKYCMNGLFAIDDTKDADSMDNKKEDAPPKTARTKTARTKADYHASFDKITSLDRLGKWIDAWMPEAKKELSAQDYKTLESTLEQHRSICK